MFSLVSPMTLVHPPIESKYDHNSSVASRHHLASSSPSSLFFYYYDCIKKEHWTCEADTLEDAIMYFSYQFDLTTKPKIKSIRQCKKITKQTMDEAKAAHDKRERERLHAANIIERERQQLAMVVEVRRNRRRLMYNQYIIEHDRRLDEKHRQSRVNRAKTHIHIHQNVMLPPFVDVVRIIKFEVIPNSTRILYAYVNDGNRYIVGRNSSFQHTINTTIEMIPGVPGLHGIHDIPDTMDTKAAFGTTGPLAIRFNSKSNIEHLMSKCYTPAEIQVIRNCLGLNQNVDTVVDTIDVKIGQVVHTSPALLMDISRLGQFIPEDYGVSRENFKEMASSILLSVFANAQVIVDHLLGYCLKSIPVEGTDLSEMLKVSSIKQYDPHKFEVWSQRLNSRDFESVSSGMVTDVNTLQPWMWEPRVRDPDDPNDSDLDDLDEYYHDYDDLV
jgi:hypothetical protein